MALWSLMHVAVTLGLPSIQIWGDSQVIINWARTITNLNVLDLIHWCDRILALKSHFSTISFTHIYREYNSSADSLSKEALTLDMGVLKCKEYYDGEMIGCTTIQLF